MKRPHVVCHMMATVDGRIKTERWQLTPAAEAQYEAVHALHRADAWLCGRETFQRDFLEQPRAAKFPPHAGVPPGDFIADYPKQRGRAIYAVAVDAGGKLRWESAILRGDRLVVLTTAKASTGYLADLRSKGISYLVCGARDVDFQHALKGLHRHFKIGKVMLEGGGRLNGALLAAGLVDEISLLICPYADGSRELPTVFDAEEKLLKRHATALKLISVKQRPGDVVWLRYRAR